MKTFEALVKEEDNGIRVWKFVLSQWKAVVKSRVQMRRCFKRGEVSVNGAIAEVTKILALGDVVQIKFDHLAAHEAVYGREKLDVRYEDDDLAVVIKPSGKTMFAFGYMIPFSLRPTPSADVGHEQHTSLGAIASEYQSLETTIQEQECSLEEDESDSEDDGDMPSNISPTLGQQHRLPCAIHGLEKASNGLVLVAKSAHMRSILMQMHRDGDILKTFRVICHGAWVRRSVDDIELASSDAIYDSSSSIPIDAAALDAVCINTIHVVKVTPSNEAGSLSTLEINPCSSAMGVNVRRYLMSMQHPVVGDSGSTKPLKANRNKGLMSALARIEFIHPKHQTPIVISMEEPTKFEQLRNREEKAYLQRQAGDMEELRKGGLEPASAYSRLSERPIAYMVGEKDFCNMRFKVSPATLIPRSSTETLVQAAISLAQDKPVKILDVGTGSGCLLLALLRSLPSATGVGIDISKNALQVAETNSALHDLNDRATFQLGDMGCLEDSSDLRQSFDILVCNPPYLDSGKAAKLTKLFAGTEFEPPVALFAEKEGYGAYELLAASILRDLKSPDSRHIMAKDGRVVLEIGSGMGPRVREIFKFLEFEVGLKDKQDSERCLVFAIPSLSLEESALA